MNAVEIEEAVSNLALQPFDRAEFPYAFLQAFGNKETTIKRLRTGASNKSDLGGVLQTGNIHLAVVDPGQVTRTLAALKASPATVRAKARFVLATDGDAFEAEDLETGETVACAYPQFPDHFGFFLPLAGITTVKQVRDSSFDIRATSRLNRLYVELLKDNPSWASATQRHEMNHFMARLIFCFFAEDTGIFNGNTLFTSTIEQMSARDSSNTHEVIGEAFRAMNTPIADRATAKLPRWADTFPYVNGGLFSGSLDVPKFSKISRSYLLHIGGLDWTKINPDIFGSMIQAVADDEERGELGMHYTSVPNILKVLDPLFLDDLRGKLDEAGDNPRMLLNLRKRIARIRVFDPACGSGNFLVIAYKQMRELESQINARRGEPGRKSDIPLTNFRGIELRDFSAEIARLALIIAEFQCDVLYLGQKEALAEFLPLNSQNWITCGNALRLDWESICPPTGTGVKFHADDLFESSLEQAQIDFANEGGETYICGNPPYLGSRRQTDSQKDDLKQIFEGHTTSWKSLDYVAGWFMKAAKYGSKSDSAAAFVATNSICQGLPVPLLWPLIFRSGQEIIFAYRSFKWTNLASNNAGVTVSIVGISSKRVRAKTLFNVLSDGSIETKQTEQINAYLVPSADIFVDPERQPYDQRPEMLFGNMPRDGGFLCLTNEEKQTACANDPGIARFIRRYAGAEELIQGSPRYCLWIEESDYEEALRHDFIRRRLDQVTQVRASSSASSTRDYSRKPFRFVQIQGVASKQAIAIAGVSSERRDYLPVDLYDSNTILSNALFGIYDAALWNFALLASRIHLVWIATVCGKLETRYRYSNTLGWNTFPIPVLTEKNKADLERCAKDILLARESYFPASIADLYDPDQMPSDLRAAHERNDEVVERIYVGRRFRNDTERLERLFELYTKVKLVPNMTKRRETKDRT